MSVPCCCQPLIKWQISQYKFFPPNFKVVVVGTVGGSGPDLLLITKKVICLFRLFSSLLLQFIYSQAFMHAVLLSSVLLFSHTHTHLHLKSNTHTHTEFPTSFFFWCVFLFCSIHQFHQLSVFKITQQRQQQYTTIQFSWQRGGPLWTGFVVNVRAYKQSNPNMALNFITLIKGSYKLNTGAETGLC